MIFTTDILDGNKDKVLKSRRDIAGDIGKRLGMNPVNSGSFRQFLAGGTERKKNELGIKTNNTIFSNGDIK